MSKLIDLTGKRFGRPGGRDCIAAAHGVGVVEPVPDAFDAEGVRP